MQPKSYSVREAAALANITRQYMYYLIARREGPVVTRDDNGVIRIAEDDLAAWIEHEKLSLCEKLAWVKAQTCPDVVVEMPTIVPEKPFKHPNFPPIPVLKLNKYVPYRYTAT